MGDASVALGFSHCETGTHPGAARYSGPMAFDRTRTLRGALAGSVAAAVWLAQQPLDKRLWRGGHDDAELLGRLAGTANPAVGALLHVQNGALFGALYANIAPSLPVPPALRGPLVGVVEHLATWPAMGLVNPALVRSGRAFLQSTWRHLLFGVVLGELERRLNGPVELRPVSDEAVASNGHGSAAHLVATR
jgi:xanthosine utilization system XapX-like protein